MDHIIHFYIVFTTFFNFVPNIFAPWLPGVGELVFDPDTRMSCGDWLVHVGFDEMRTAFNKEQSLSREKNGDGSAFFWAVIYAQVLVAFPDFGTKENYYTPFEFCSKRGLHQNRKIPFEAFADKRATCEGWIQAYGFAIGNPIANFDMASKRSKDAGAKISLWAEVYAMFITFSENWEDAIEISEFCIALVNIQEEMFFMTIKSARKTCREWIELSGFGSTVQLNVEKAVNEINSFQKFKNAINSWTMYYVQHLITTTSAQNLMGQASSSKNAGTEAMAPVDFCKHRGFSNTSMPYYVVIKGKKR